MGGVSIAPPQATTTADNGSPDYTLLTGLDLTIPTDPESRAKNVFLPETSSDQTSC